MKNFIKEYLDNYKNLDYNPDSVTKDLMIYNLSLLFPKLSNDPEYYKLYVDYIDNLFKTRNSYAKMLNIDIEKANEHLADMIEVIATIISE